MLEPDGRMLCWGAGRESGSLGTGSYADVCFPVEPLSSFALSNISRIAAAATSDVPSASTCAVLMSGDVKCWGSNADGQVCVIDSCLSSCTIRTSVV